MARVPKHKQPDPPAAGSNPDSTFLETLEEIRRAVRARRSSTTQDVLPDTRTFRPMRRPPMALLCILDDGRQAGEWVRIRVDHVVLGRDEGDVVIPHDGLMSGQHAELTRRLEDGRHRWFLTDLQSTNGTYVRISHALLKHNQELLIGSHRYRFDAAPQGPADHSDNKKTKKTRDWDPLVATELIPTLVELTAQGDGNRFFLPKAENWLGRDANSCAIAVNDPLVSPRHARFFRDPKGRWQVENANALNGTWLRVEEMALAGACQFQLGEQRFLLRVL